MENDQVNANSANQDQATSQGLYTNQNQNQSLGWRAALPDEWKEHDFVKSYQKPGDFVKSAYEIAQERDALKTKMEGYIPKITDQSTEEEKVAFYKAIGRPDKPEDYNITIPEGVNQDPAFISEFAKVAFDAGVPTGVVQKLASWYMSKQQVAEKTFSENLKSQRDNAVNELKQKWGNKYETNLDSANKVVERLVSDERYQYMKGRGYMDDAAMVEFFHELSGKISEDSFVKPGGTPPPNRPQTPGGKPMLKFQGM